MARKQKGNLSLVKSDEAKEAQWKEERDRREREESSWMLTGAEVKARVGEIRRTLEGFNEMITALHFDIIHPEQPPSLRRGDEGESSALAERLNPTIIGRCKRIQNRLGNVFEHDDVGMLKWAVADTAFGIGVLAGAIFTGAPEKEIDRLERGLAYAAAQRYDCKKD